MVQNTKRNLLPGNHVTSLNEKPADESEILCGLGIEGHLQGTHRQCLGGIGNALQERSMVRYTNTALTSVPKAESKQVEHGNFFPYGYLKISFAAGF